MLPAARRQGRAGQARQGKELPGQSWRALPIQTNLVLAWELLQKRPALAWDLTKLKPCDAAGRDEARGACSGSG